jgi:hypothetical protein
MKLRSDLDRPGDNLVDFAIATTAEESYILEMGLIILTTIPRGNDAPLPSGIVDRYFDFNYQHY